MASVAERAAITDILRGCPSPVIVDLGSYDGSDARWMRGACLLLGQTPRVVILEPDTRNFDAIVAQNWEGAVVSLRCMAIAGLSGICDLYPCDNDLGEARASSSIRKPTGHLEHFKWCKFGDPVKVVCIALDDLYRHEFLDHVDVLWVDIQGAERNMIAGGVAALKRTRFMFIEAEEVEFYEGQALRPELLALLPEWEIVKTFDYNLLLRNKEYTAA